MVGPRGGKIILIKNKDNSVKIFETLEDKHCKFIDELFKQPVLFGKKECKVIVAKNGRMIVTFENKK